MDVKPQSSEAAPHQRAAMRLHILIVVVFALLAFACIVGGTFAVWKGANADTTFNLFGVRLTTGNVGVALVGIGIVVAYFTIRSVLKSQIALAALPPDRTRARRRSK